MMVDVEFVAALVVVANVLIVGAGLFGAVVEAFAGKVKG